MAEKERRVTIPLMVRYVDDIQFVEDDNDTVSETEPSSDIGTGLELTIFVFIAKRDHLCQEAVTGIFRYRYITLPPVSQSIAICATSDRPRNFEPRSSTEDGFHLAPPLQSSTPCHREDFARHGTFNELQTFYTDVFVVCFVFKVLFPHQLNFTNLGGNVYCEIPCKDTKVEFLDIPRFLHSRSNSTPSNSSAQTSPMLERKSSNRKKSNHDYEKLSVTSNSSKKSTVERIAESTFFRRRTDTSHERKVEQRGEEDEHVLEVVIALLDRLTKLRLFSYTLSHFTSSITSPLSAQFHLAFPANANIPIYMIPNLHNHALFLGWLERIAIQAPKKSQEDN
ncbi:uncharacterized protein TNCV_5059401 [Trichonephila clavipes]|nr:uncharacterized protein TNCV_5059401 [Trichonephila clavipes]